MIGIAFNTAPEFEFGHALSRLTVLTCIIRRSADFENFFTFPRVAGFYHFAVLTAGELFHNAS